MKAIFSLFCLCLLSCGKVKQIDTSDIKEIMRNSKVKRVTEKQLLEKISEVGEAARAKLDGDYRVECQSAYNLEEYRVEVYNSAHIQPGTDVKGQLLEAYQYSLKSGIQTGVNIQKLNDTLYAYSFPLAAEAYQRSVCGNDFALVILSQRRLILQL